MWLRIASESVNQPWGIHSSTGLRVGSEPFHRVMALMKPTGLPSSLRSATPT